MSPKYVGNLVERILTAKHKVDVLWVYGKDDVAVSNSAASDPGTWGPDGLLPGFPGAQKYPPQPMMDQIRTLLDDYSKCGGKYREVAVEGSGHVPFISHQDEFNRVFHAFLDTGAMSGFGNGA
jgi:pimeloyl-ACP methyl ester carboxylesterase